LGELPSSPFLSDQDIAMRNEWLEDISLPTGLMAHAYRETGRRDEYDLGA
jgi:hypothetical protein